MRAGLLRQPFRLLEPSETGGDAAVTYTDRGLAWGSLEANASSHNGLTGSVNYSVTMRQRRDLTVTRHWRLGLGSRRFVMTGLPVDPDGRGAEWRLEVMELTD